MKDKNGFSLIELIVVITIIMLITVVGIISYVGVNKNARDGRRKSDIEKIRTALEMYKQQNGAYPATGNVPSQDSGNVLVTGDYLAGWPQDPQTGRSYQYVQISSYKYEVRACLESLSTSVGGSCCASGAVCTYKVTNP